MLLPDVNVLVYAFRWEVEHHERYPTWLASIPPTRRPAELTADCDSACRSWRTEAVKRYTETNRGVDHRL